MHWCDEEFFLRGAFEADVKSDRILLGKGGEVSRVRSFTKHAKTSFYLKDFFSNEYIQYIPRETIRVSKKELIESLEQIQPVSFISTGTEDQLYERDFASLSQSFGLSLDKVVLISREEFKANNFSSAKLNLFQRSLRFGAGFSYGFWNEDYGIVGSTPEVLYSLEQNKLNTFALAGTAKKGQEEELLHSDKDRHEHDLVIRDLEEKLSRFSKTIDIGATHIIGFKDIIHMRTDIEAELKAETDLAELTSLLSPTAALGGYPKERALKFLLNTEYYKKYPERFFGSAFGVISEELNQFVVMIRNVQWKNKTFFIESGGGVVPESHLSKELEEINWKRSVIRSHYL